MTEVRPGSVEELAGALAEASAAGRRVGVRGGGTRSRRGRPGPPPDLVVHTRGLDRVVAHEPADLTLTVEAGALVTDVAALVAERGQRWPQAEVREGSTVGGVLAAAASGRGRLRHGPVRDSLLEVVLATGDGRVVKGGGRTVKGVSGYDVPRLAVGSLGTLGVIVQATLKLWPEPPTRTWHADEGALADRLDRARAALAAPVAVIAVLVGHERSLVCLEGPPEDTSAPEGWAPVDPPADPGWTATLEVGVPATSLGWLVTRLAGAGRPFEAQMGVGVCRVGVETAEHVYAVRRDAAELGGHAVVVDAPEELRGDPFGPPPAGVEIMRRLRAAFDPSGVMNAASFPVP